MNPEHQKPVNIERLKRFVYLATQEDINLSRVARELHLPQPYLSRQIQQLEEELGVELFARNPRLALTSWGEIVLKEAKDLLGKFDKFQQLSQQVDTGERGKLSVGINTSISNSLLPDIIRVFSSSYPKGKLELQEILCKESQQRLQNRTLDVYFDNLYNLRHVDINNILTYEIISKESLLMVLPQQHPLANNPQVKLTDFANEPFILPCRETVPALHTLTQIACGQAGFQPKIVQEATLMSTILSLVVSGMGVAILPANVKNLQRTGVVYREIIEILPIVQTAMVWCRDNHCNILHNFLNVVRQISGQL
jgi:DNA-binding transcriptional LysR family regulator